MFLFIWIFLFVIRNDFIFQHQLYKFKWLFIYNRRNPSNAFYEQKQQQQNAAISFALQAK